MHISNNSSFSDIESAASFYSNDLPNASMEGEMVESYSKGKPTDT